MLKIFTPKTLSLIIVLIGIILAVSGYYISSTGINRMQGSRTEDLRYNTFQLAVEQYRLLNELQGFSQAIEGFDRDSVNYRYDILWSRFEIMQSGHVAVKLEHYPTVKSIMSQTFDELKTFELTIIELKNDAASRLKAFDMIPTLNVNIERLRDANREVQHGEINLVADLQRTFGQTAWITTILTIFTVIFCAAVVFLLAGQAAKLKIVADENHDLAEKARSANQSKIAFLKMMSHELRTPMNGILGMIALARQAGLPLSQDRMIGQAEKSGRRMMVLIEDIMNYASVESGEDNKEEETRSYSTFVLKKDLKERFQIIVPKDTVTVSVHFSDDFPPYIYLPKQKFIILVSQIVKYLVETLNLNKIDTVFEYHNGNILCNFEFYDPNYVWKTIKHGSGELERSMLASAISLDILHWLGGSISSTDLANQNKNVLNLVVPAESGGVSQGSTVLLIKTRVLEVLYKATLQSKNIPIVDLESGIVPRIIFIENSWSAIREDIEEIRRLYPDTVFISLGRSNFPDLFDKVIKEPADLEAIKDLDRLMVAS